MLRAQLMVAVHSGNSSGLIYTTRAAFVITRESPAHYLDSSLHRASTYLPSLILTCLHLPSTCPPFIVSAASITREHCKTTGDPADTAEVSVRSTTSEE